MTRALVVIAAIVLAGCVTPPQTSDEVRQGVKAGATFTKIERQEFNRPFKTVFTDVKANTDKCLNVIITTSTPGAYGPVVDYIPFHASSRTMNAKAAETVFQQSKRATGKMPEGGYFIMVMDTEEIVPGKTSVTIYGPSVGYDGVYKSVIAWAKGEKAACPKLP
jgi:hypothetical protein